MHPPVICSTLKYHQYSVEESLAFEIFSFQTCLVSSLRQIDTRVYQFVTQVYDQVHDDDEGSQENSGSHNQRIITGLDSLDKVTAQSRNREYLLNNHTAAQCKCNLPGPR